MFKNYNNFSFHFVIVPGLLEYESIPGVSRSNPFGRGKTKIPVREAMTEEIITVEDVTKTVSEMYIHTAKASKRIEKYFLYLKNMFLNQENIRIFFSK